MLNFLEDDLNLLIKSVCSSGSIEALEALEYLESPTEIEYDFQHLEYACMSANKDMIKKILSLFDSSRTRYSSELILIKSAYFYCYAWIGYGNCIVNIMQNATKPENTPSVRHSESALELLEMLCSTFIDNQEASREEFGTLAYHFCIEYDINYDIILYNFPISEPIILLNTTNVGKIYEYKLLRETGEGSTSTEGT